MAELSKIEEKSILVQNDLMKDTISNFGHINYAITSVAGQALNDLTTAKYSDGKENTTAPRQKRK